MLKRLIDLLKSFWNMRIRCSENPYLVLRKLRDDLREKIPTINCQIADIIAFYKSIEAQKKETERLISILEPQIIQGVKGGDQYIDSTRILAKRMCDAKEDLKTQNNLLDKSLKEAERILKLKNMYEAKIKKQIAEIEIQISRLKRAEIESDFASIISSFNIGNHSETLARMVEKIDEKVAMAEAKTEIVDNISGTSDEKVAILYNQYVEKIESSNTRTIGSYMSEQREKA